MTDDVKKFQPEIVGENFRFDPDEILENAKGGNFQTICIIGETEDGELYVAGNANVGETLVLMLRFQHQLVTGELS